MRMNPARALALSATVLAHTTIGHAAVSSGYRCTGIQNPDLEFDLGVHETHASIKAGRDICMPALERDSMPTGGFKGYTTYSIRKMGLFKQVSESERCWKFIRTATGRGHAFHSLAASPELRAGRDFGQAALAYESGDSLSPYAVEVLRCERIEQ